MSMHQLKWFLSLAAVAMIGNAQEANPNPQQAPPNGGWRKFGDAQQANPDPRYNSNPGFSNRTPDYPPQTYAPAPPPPPTMTLAPGTWITVRVNQPLSSDHSQPGDAFTASLVQPIVTDGRVVARPGQTLQGRVAEAIKAGRASGTSRLGVEITQLALVDGQQIPVKTQLVERRGNTSIGRDVGAVGVTAGVGAAIGAGAAGPFGAGIGALAGAGAATIGVLVTRGKPTVLYPETVLTFRLEQPVTFNTERSAEAFAPVSREDYEGPPSLRQGGPGPRPGPGYYPPPAYYGPGYYGPSYYGGGLYPYWGPSFGFSVGPRFYGRGFYGRGFGRRW